jgi:hypothetical protein
MSRHIWLSAFLLAGLFLLVNRPAGAFELDSEGKKAYKTLQTTPYFAMGGIGIAGTTSEGEKALRILLKEKEGSEAFQKLLKQGTTEGRIYALLGLKLSARESYRKSLPAFLDSKANVKQLRGCILGPRPVAEVAKEINKDVYR